MTNAKAKKRRHEFYKLLASIRNEEEARDLSKDLFTPRELHSFAKRWEEIQLIAEGMPQRRIMSELQISMSKITRGSRMLRYGTGAFLKFLKRFKKPINLLFLRDE